MMSNRTRRRTTVPPLTASWVETVILTAGLVAAAASGVAAYRAVGPYADGPLNAGLYRMEEPETGRQLVYREVRSADGVVRRYLFDNASRTLTEIRVIRAGGETPDVRVHMNNGVLEGVTGPGRSFERDPKTGVARVGFSLRGNGVVDAWEYRDANGTLQKIEVSRRQNGVVDRWEYYKDDQLARVEEDDTGDGRVDRWLTYDAGILIQEARDRNGDGRPDR